MKIRILNILELMNMLHIYETSNPYKIGGNVMNTGLITNLPNDAVVEAPCFIDRNGVTSTFVGKLQEQLAALNRTNINTKLLTIEAAFTKKRELNYMTAMCDYLIEAHGDWLPKYR